MTKKEPVSKLVLFFLLKNKYGCEKKFVLEIKKAFQNLI